MKVFLCSKDVARMYIKFETAQKSIPEGPTDRTVPKLGCSSLSEVIQDLLKKKYQKKLTFDLGELSWGQVSDPLHNNLNSYFFVRVTALPIVVVPVFSTVLMPIWTGFEHQSSDMTQIRGTNFRLKEHG